VQRKAVVTVDGPAGSGKTVCGRLAALELGVAFISSGLYFRAAAFEALRQAIPLEDESILAAMVGKLPVRFVNEPDSLRVLVGGEDRTDALKSPEVTSRVKTVAESPEVRRILAQAMRRTAAREPVLVEGRDMGTVVFPEAPLKFFLDADIHCRVERRRLELLRLGDKVDRALLERRIRERDERDRTREISPLRVPEGAVVVDTSRMSIEEVVDTIVRTVREKGVFG